MLLRFGLSALCSAWIACSDAPTLPSRSADADLESRLRAHLANSPSGVPERGADARAIGAQPLRFEPNRGQIADAAVRFAARGEHQDLSVTATGFAIAPRAAAREGARRALRVSLLGANPAPRIEPLDRVAGVSHYYRGDDPAGWQTHVPGFARVALRDVHPGIDLVLRGSGTQLEYDFEVAPGADPAAIALAFGSADAIALDAAGDLQAQLGGGVVVEQRRPVAFQQIDGARVEVAARWVVDAEHRARFALGEWDRRHPLVIDPVVFVWSTYLGGSDFNSDGAEAIAVGADGRVYVVGSTGSADFPTANAMQPARVGGSDAFVTVFEADGQQLVYSTFLGGNASEVATGVAVDADGRAFVTGQTFSSSFPVLAASQPVFGGETDAFVTVLDASGALLRSTFLGGAREERGGEIALDAAGRATVAGSTGSPSFPTTVGAFDRSCGTDGLCNVSAGFPKFDLFAVRFGATGAIDYATFLGGENYEFFGGLALDEAGAAHLAGYTRSAAFPTVNALQPQPNGAEDAVLARFSADGSALVYSTYLGGDQTEFVGGLAVDGDGNAYLTGFTASPDFPLVNPLQSERRGSNDAFVAKLPPDGSALLYATLLGGNDTFVNGDAPYGIAVDAAGRAVLAGETTSPDFPLVQPRLGDAVPPDSFVAVLEASGSSLVAASYVGGAGYDSAYGLAIDGAGGIYVAGITEPGFPTEEAFQPQHAGGQYDAFAMRLSLAPADLACEVATGATQYGDGDPIVASALRFANLTGFDVAARVRIVLEPPAGAPIAVANVNAVLAENFDVDLAPAPILTVGPGTPRGDYTLRCEIADPATGTPYAADAAAFAVQ